MASNNQTVTLEGISLSDLSPANFTIQSTETGREILSQVGGDGDGGTGPGDPDDPQMFMITLESPWQTITDFDPSADMIHLGSGVTAELFEIVAYPDPWAYLHSEQGAEVLSQLPDSVAIRIWTANSELVSQTVLYGISPAELTMSNFMSAEQGVLTEISDFLDQPVEPPAGPQMIMIMPDSPSEVIGDFNPATDMLHLEAGVIAERLNFADNPETIADVGGLTIQLLNPDGSIANEIVLSNISASDLTMNNFMVAEESALNEVATLLGEAIVTPVTGGFDVVYDNDGSNPPVPTGASDLGGVKWAADFGADDIIGFNPAADEIDFGNASVHGLILTMTPNGEPVIDNPWGPDMQILQGVQTVRVVD